MNSERFINPYNFVPLRGKCERGQASQGNLTGKITCTLETKTPLFIPSSGEQNSEFFHYDDPKSPAIPGSELRGTIRSVFEAAFNGCLSQVNMRNYERKNILPRGMKESSQNTLQNILEAQGGYSPCNCLDQVCPICNIFGLVNGEKALASRIRFSDAMSETKIEFIENTITLPALGEPRPGVVEFYTELSQNLKGSEKNYRTYNWFYKDKKQKWQQLDYAYIKIRGRKFYWHHEIDEKILKRKKSSQNKTMEFDAHPVKEGQTFTFTVYFERFTKEEIAQLCWALDFGGSEFHAHKIGRAKPLGFGSVKISVNKIMTRTIDKESGQWILKEFTDNLDTIETNDEMKILLNIMQYPSKLQGKVQYPTGKDTDESSYEWFDKNKIKKEKRFYKVLPTIEEELEPMQKGKWLWVKKL